MKKIIIALLSLALVVSFSMGTASAANSLREGSKGISIGFIDTSRSTAADEDRIYTIYGKYFTMSLLIDAAPAVVYSEQMQRVVGVGVFGIKQEFAVGLGRVENIVFIKAGQIEFLKIIFGKQFTAMQTVYFPRIFKPVFDNPAVCGYFLFAGWAVTGTPDVPGTVDGGAEHQIPELIIRKF